MKFFHLMVPEEINISVQKALTFKYEVQRDRMEFAECPFAEDRMLIPTYLCHRRISCCLPSVPFNKILQENIARPMQKVAIEHVLITHTGSIVERIRLISQVQLMWFWIPAFFFFSRCPNNDKARVILKKKKKDNKSYSNSLNTTEICWRADTFDPFV